MSVIFIILKYIAFSALTVVSMLLSYNMFSQLSSVPREQALLAIVAVSIEFLKIFSIVKGNTLWNMKLKKQALQSYLLAFALTLLSIFASYGYNLVVVNRSLDAQNNTSAQLNIENNILENNIVLEQIENLNKQINSALDRQKALSPDAITTWMNISKQVNQLEKAKKTFTTRQLELNNELAELKINLNKDKANSKSTTTMFTLMADTFHVNRSVMMMILLLSIRP